MSWRVMEHKSWGNRCFHLLGCEDDCNYEQFLLPPKIHKGTIRKSYGIWYAHIQLIWEQISNNVNNIQESTIRYWPNRNHRFLRTNEAFVLSTRWQNGFSTTACHLCKEFSEAEEYFTMFLLEFFQTISLNEQIYDGFLMLLL